MKKENDNQWLDPMLAKHIQREPERFDFTEWAAKHPEEAQMLCCGVNDSSRSTKTKTFKIWRLIMESKITRYSAAAVIVLAMTLVLTNPLWIPGNGGVVLAEVQQNVAGIETMMIRGTKTFTCPGEPDRIFEFDGIKCHFDLVKYHSTHYGLVEEGYIGGNLIYRITFNIPDKQTLILLPKYKKYLRFTSTSTDALAEAIELFGNPNGILNLLLGSEYKKLGRDKVDGVEVEAFEFQDKDKEPFEAFKELLPKTVFDIKSFKGKIWIAIKEQMPVRIEADLTIGKSFMTMFHDLNLHEVNTLEDFNLEIDDNIFDTNPPEDYTQVTISDILQMVPTEAKAGAATLGIIPAGFVFWRRRKRKKQRSAGTDMPFRCKA